MQTARLGLLTIYLPILHSCPFCITSALLPALYSSQFFTKVHWTSFSMATLKVGDPSWQLEQYVWEGADCLPGLIAFIWPSAASYGTRKPVCPSPGPPFRWVLSDQSLPLRVLWGLYLYLGWFKHCPNAIRMPLWNARFQLCIEAGRGTVGSLSLNLDL